MPPRRPALSLYDPRHGDPAFQFHDLKLGRSPVEPPRTNYFTIYCIETGAGRYWADTAEHAFGPGSLLFFVPYQYIRFAPQQRVRGTIIQFHANFLCIETFHAEAGCSGTLFNDPYGVPSVVLDESTQHEVAELIGRCRREQAGGDLAFDEVVLAYLKVLLIVAARRKLAQPGAACAAVVDARHPLLAPLRELIEQHYRTLHAPAEYAALLHTTPKTLGRVVREHLGKTLTNLIRERILTHAKWELLHTLRPVKEIAREVGYTDELYFSRMFKKATGLSPTYFREFETAVRGGSNLSMTSVHAPIRSAAAVP